jgi:hypothetical protein
LRLSRIAIGIQKSGHMDAKVIKIGDDEEDNPRGKLVDIVDALDREIDLTWALIGLVETVNRESGCEPYGRGLLALAHRLVDGLSAVRQTADYDAALCFRDSAPRFKLGEAALETNVSPPPQGERPARLRKLLTRLSEESSPANHS